MKKSDIDLIGKLRVNIDRYLEDQKSNKPVHQIADIPLGIRGYLADLLYIDKVENDALVNFIGILLHTHKGRSDAEIMRLLTDISSSLGSFNFDADDTGKAH